MAGLDTSIALGIKPVDFGDPNEGRMNALRAQMLQQQMQMGQFNMMKAQRDMQYQDQQRARAAAEAARQKAKEEAARREFMTAYGATGNVNVPIPAQVAEPGAASDVGMLGSQNAMPEYQPSSMMMEQPKDLRAATNALIQGGKFDAANLGMGYGNAVTEAEKKDVELRKAKTEASSSEAKAIDENLKPFRAYAAAVNSPEAAAAYVSAMFDHPVLGTMAQKVSGQTKEQAIASAMKDYAADPQRWMAAHVGLNGEQVMSALGAGKRPKPESVAGKIYEDMRNLDKNDPDYAIKLAGLQRAANEATGVKAKDVGTADASIANAEQAIKDIDAIMTHPELKSRAGSIGLPYVAGQIAGTKTFGLEDRVKQIQGEAFLNAFNMLRGGGAITDTEGKKATTAINRMKLSLSYDDFKKAADDAKEVLQNGMKRAQELKAKGSWGGEPSAPAAGAPASAPAVGAPSVDDLLKKYGG
jgi:hypothetical protein